MRPRSPSHWRLRFRRIRELERAEPPREEQRKRDWTIIAATVATALATLGILIVAAWIGRTQQEVMKLQEMELFSRAVNRANIISFGGDFQFIKPSPDAPGLIYAEVYFRNASNNFPAEELSIMYQIYDGDSWRGPSSVGKGGRWHKRPGIGMTSGGSLEEFMKGEAEMERPARKVDTIDLEPGEELRTWLKAKTMVTQAEACSRDRIILLASRMDWENPDGSAGCKVIFIRLACLFPDGSWLVARNVPQPLPSEVSPPPFIWPCPE